MHICIPKANSLSFDPSSSSFLSTYVDVGPSSVNWGSKFVDIGPYDLIAGLRGISDTTVEIGSNGKQMDATLVMVVLVVPEMVAVSETSMNDINNSALCFSIDNDSTQRHR